MSVTYLILYIYIIFIFLEIFIISLKLTGLSREKSRFQVISLFTSTGFTTKESELITQHPIRRKIAERIMIFKYIGGIVGTATLFNVYANWVVDKINLKDILIWGGLLLLIFIIIRSNWAIKKIDYVIEYELKNQSYKNKKKFNSSNLWTRDDFGIIDIVLGEGNTLINCKLKEADLKNEYIQVLQIDKGDMHYPFPKPDYIFEVGDKITLYGKLKNIQSLASNTNLKICKINILSKND